MSLNREDFQNLLGFKNLAGLDTKIVLSSAVGPTILLKRETENDPWFIAGNFFGGLFDELLSSYVGKVLPGVDIKNELLPNIQKLIEKESMNQILAKVEEAKGIAKGIEGSSLAKLTIENLDDLKNFVIAELNPLLDSPVVQMMDKEYAALSKIQQLFERDYPALVKKHQDLVSWCNDTLSKLESSSKLNEHNKQVVEEVRSNIEILENDFRMTHSRKIPDNWNKMAFAKKMFETRFESADDAISALN